MPVHELLKAVEEHIGALRKERPKETLEVVDSVVRVLQAVPAQKPFVIRCFSKRFHKAGPRLSLSNSVRLSHVTPVIDRILVGKPTTSAIITWRYLCGHLLES